MKIQSISSLSCEQLCAHIQWSQGDEYSIVIEKFKINQISGDDFVKFEQADYEALKLPWKLQRKLKEIQKSGNVPNSSPTPGVSNTPITTTRVPNSSPTPGVSNTPITTTRETPETRRDINQLKNQINDLAGSIALLRVQINNKNPINNFSSLPPSSREKITNPSPQSRTIPIVDPTKRVDGTAVPRISNEIPSLINATSLQNLPRGRGRPVPLSSTCDGPNDNVVFSQVYDESKNSIAILPNIPHPYDTSSYGEYLVTIFDESGEREVVKSLVHVNPPESIVLPRKFVIKTPLGELIEGSFELFYHNKRVYQGPVTQGCADLPQNFLDGTYEIKIKPNLVSLSPLTFKMIVYNSERTASSDQYVNRNNKNPDEMDFVLVWGETPRDLDSHIWCIHPNGNIDHVYFLDKEIGDMSLDHDVIKGFGPETIRFKRLKGCKYVYAVHRYSFDGEIAQSDAKLTICNKGLTLFQRRIPNTKKIGATFWVVCIIDGTSGDITFKDDFEFHNNFKGNDIALKYR
ncbi:hypothetical protein ACTA71_004014 [Dictyostelium dimigraforme]